MESEALEETNRALAAAGIEVPMAGGEAGGKPAPPAEKDYDNNPDDIAKRIKAIQKKIKSAVALRTDEEGGKELNVDQKAKILAIPDMEKELAEFEGKLKALSS